MYFEKTSTHKARTDLFRKPQEVVRKNKKTTGLIIGYVFTAKIVLSS